MIINLSLRNRGQDRLYIVADLTSSVIRFTLRGCANVFIFLVRESAVLYCVAHIDATSGVQLHNFVVLIAQLAELFV